VRKSLEGVAVNQLDKPLDNINATSQAAESHRPHSYLATPLSYKTATDTRSTNGFAGLSAINAPPMTTSTADPIRNPTF